MIEPPSFMSGKAFCAVNKVPRTLTLNVSQAFLGNGAEWVAEPPDAGASKEDIDTALLLFDYLEQPIEVGKIAGIALNASDILTDFFDCFV